jgi:hypothetical protein
LSRFSSPIGGRAAALVVVAGPHFQLVGEALVGVVEGVVLPDGMAIEEIRPAAGADEEGVGGEYPTGQEDGDEILNVPRGVQELEGGDPQGRAGLRP